MMVTRGGRLRAGTPWLLTLGLALSFTVPQARAHADACSPVSVGVDTSHGNSYFAVYDGSAYGQVFEAMDTVIQAISVWREWTINNTSLRLYVLEVDSTATPYPRILRIGPTLQIENGDGVHPIRFRFVLDPPLVLPRPGYYEFAVQVAPPECDGATSLLGDTRNPYPGGAAWRHPRTDYLDCRLRSARPGDPGDDLIFELEFCVAPTPVRRSSWGSLKMRYR